MQVEVIKNIINFLGGKLAPVKRLWQRLRPHRILVGIVVIIAGLVGLNWRARTAVTPGAIVGATTASQLSWFRPAGSTHTDDGVHIDYLDRQIVNQDGSGGQPNPPVNLAGSHFTVNGNFELRAGLQEPEAARARLRFYAELPVVYDEWRREPASLEIAFEAGKFTVSIWDGRAESPTESISADLATDDEQILTITRANGRFTITVGNSELKIDDHRIFDSGRIWAGASAGAPDKSWTLTFLTAQALGQGSVALTDTALDKPVTVEAGRGLRALAGSTAHPIRIGSAISLAALAGDDRYRQIAAQEFSSLTPENEMKAQFLQPLKGVFAFAEADALVAFAGLNGMTVHGHALVFGEANPAWMQSTPRTEREKVMTDHVKAVVEHYRGQVPSWDVVNEPLADDDRTLRSTIWSEAMGEQLFDKAFGAAHQADPLAKLYINEYGLEADGQRWNNFLDLIDRLLYRGVPIDGVGFQAHVRDAGDQIDPVVLKRHIQQLGYRGLSVRISEIDVDGEDEGLAFQTQQYSATLQACLESPNCVGYTTWGLTDRYGSTTEIRSYPLDLGDDLIWNADLQAKPIYQSLADVLTAAQ